MNNRVNSVPRNGVCGFRVCPQVRDEINPLSGYIYVNIYNIHNDIGKNTENSLWTLQTNLYAITLLRHLRGLSKESKDQASPEKNVGNVGNVGALEVATLERCFSLFHACARA